MSLWLPLVIVCQRCMQSTTTRPTNRVTAPSICLYLMPQPDCLTAAHIVALNVVNTLPCPALHSTAQHSTAQQNAHMNAHRYCECFASGRYCDGCNCVNCCNNMENESTRQSAVEAILERNPNAFRPKIQAGASVSACITCICPFITGCWGLFQAVRPDLLQTAPQVHMSGSNIVQALVTSEHLHHTFSLCSNPFVAVL